jgi:hypothetical protein
MSKAQPIEDEGGIHDQVIAIQFKDIRDLARLPDEVIIIESLRSGRGSRNPWYPDGRRDDLYDETTLFLRITSKYAVYRSPFGCLFAESLGEFVIRYRVLEAKGQKAEETDQAHHPV